jgi:hypothetical protein
MTSLTINCNIPLPFRSFRGVPGCIQAGYGGGPCFIVTELCKWAPLAGKSVNGNATLRVVR